MKIAILGSTGLVGNVLLRKALEKGYQVKTLVRNPDKLGDFRNRVEFITGDAFRTEDLEKTISGTEAVISTLPPDLKTKEPEKYAGRIENLLSVMGKNKVKRLIHIGGAAHGGGENEKWSTGRRMLRFFLGLLWKPVLIAKEMEWDVLKKSDIGWTLVRPPGITKGRPRGNVRADEKNLAGTRIDVEDLAGFILEQIGSDEWIRKAPLVSEGKIKSIN